MRRIEPPPTLGASVRKGEGEKLLKHVMDNEFNDLIITINERYYYWDKVKHLKTPKNVTPQELWLIAKIRRANSPFKIQFGSHQFTWFLNSHLQELLHLFDLNIGGSLESGSVIPVEDKNRYLISSLMEEAIASSQIEGAVTTRKKAKEMLRKNQAPKNKDEQMIFNNYLTIQRILEIKDQFVTVEDILAIHKLITTGTLSSEGEEGYFRTSNDINVVEVSDGKIVYSPPDSKEIAPLINQFCDFFNSDTDNPFIHPIIKGTIIHFMIGYIHPFVDGNGRTARALFYWYLLKKGYWLIEYMSISKLILKSKAQYARAYQYTEIDNNDLTYFIQYKLKTMKLAFDSLREYIQRKIEEKRQIADFIRLQNVNDRQALILKWIYEEGSLLFTVKEIQTRLAVSNQTSRTDLQGLVNLGYLESIKLNRKTEAFVKGEKFDYLIKQKK
ncbi:MAG: Fic family protein [Bacteroidota bacterium]|nr:Fic family protein [Bacteroidota bacterium]